MQYPTMTTRNPDKHMSEIIDFEYNSNPFSCDETEVKVDKDYFHVTPYLDVFFYPFYLYVVNCRESFWIPEFNAKLDKAMERDYDSKFRKPLEVG